MTSNNLRRYKVVTIQDAVRLVEEAGDSLPPEGIPRAISLEKGNITANARAVQALYSSQKGKRDTLTFTLGVSE